MNITNEMLAITIVAADRAEADGHPNTAEAFFDLALLFYRELLKEGAAAEQQSKLQAASHVLNRRF